MVEPGRELDLPQEPLGAQGDREFRSQHLDRDQPFVFRVSSQEYERRPTVAELALDRVPASEGNFQTTSEVGHGAFDAWDESMIRVSIESDQMPWTYCPTAPSYTRRNSIERPRPTSNLTITNSCLPSWEQIGRAHV